MLFKVEVIRVERIQDAELHLRMEMRVQVGASLPLNSNHVSGRRASGGRREERCFAFRLHGP